MKRRRRRTRVCRAKDQMRTEYCFDEAKAKPNRFASRMKTGAVAVILDPDVASVFRSSDAVNTFLRSVIAAIPERRHKRAKAG